MSSERIVEVTREALNQGLVRQMVEARDDQTAVASDAELLASRRQIIPDDFDCNDLWVFGYGSLIFNPVIEHTSKIKAKIFGKHQYFF